MGSATRSGGQDLRFKVASVLAEGPNNDLKLDEYTVSVEQAAAAVRTVRDEPGCPESIGSAAASKQLCYRRRGRDWVDGNEGYAASNDLLHRAAAPWAGGEGISAATQRVRGA